MQILYAIVRDIETVFDLPAMIYWNLQKKYLNNGCIKAYSIYSTVQSHELNRETIIN